jgi:ABC-2 type transport system permease protein
MHAATSTSIARPDGSLPMALGRVVGAYFAEARYEAIRMLRSPGFSIPFLVLPVPIYLFFGVLLAAPAIAERPGIANYLFSGFATFAVMGPALFGVGCALAIEREAGLLKLKRAQPAPTGAYLIAKMLMGMIFAAAAVSTLLVTAVFGATVTLSGGQLAVIALVMIVGSLPFCAMGLFIGAYASGSASPAIANVIFLPMLWLSGLFIPLPKFLEPWVVVWPAFHLNQTALGAAGVAEFSFIAPRMSAAVLIAVTVVFGGLAVRRLARKG